MPRKELALGISLAALTILIVTIVLWTQVGLFMVQPIGAVPEGRTLIVWRDLSKQPFFDSADATCLRVQSAVSLLCRGFVLAAMAKSDRIVLRLPYSETAYLLSTSGAQFER